MQYEAFDDILTDVQGPCGLIHAGSDISWRGSEERGTYPTDPIRRRALLLCSHRVCHDGCDWFARLGLWYWQPGRRFFEMQWPPPWTPLQVGNERPRVGRPYTFRLPEVWPRIGSKATELPDRLIDDRRSLPPVSQNHTLPLRPFLP